MSISKSRKTALRNLQAYVVATVICILIPLIYYRFTRGVHSLYLTLLFLWPLLLGVLPSLLKYRVVPRLRPQRRLSASLYHPGVAALTTASLLQGILEIAGTTCVWQTLLMVLGLLLVVASALAWFYKR